MTPEIDELDEIVKRDINEKFPQPCPFCGGEQEEPYDYYTTQGTKWGGLECQHCSARSGEVRTGYDEESPVFQNSAIKEWNRGSNE